MASTPALTTKRLRTRHRRLRWLLVIGLALIATAGAYIEFNYHLPEGSGPAGPTIPEELFAKTWSTRRVLLLGLGDSVTAGFGSRSGYSYFDRLAANPPDEWDDMRGRSLAAVLPNLTSRNMAVSGSNSLQHLQQIEEKLEKQPSDVFGLIVMTSGGNDLIHWYGRTPPQEGAMYGTSLAQSEPWIAAYGSRLDHMFALLQIRFPGGCRIFIADIYDPSDGRGHPESVGLPPWPDMLAVHGAYNAMLRSVATRNPCVRIVPMQAVFLGHGVHCRKFWMTHFRMHDPHYWFSSNLEDPNERGYDAIRRVFLSEIVKESAAFQQGK